MRTDEKAGQAAKYELRQLEGIMRLEDVMEPDGAYVFMTPEERKNTKIKIEVLRRVCGV